MYRADEDEVAEEDDDSCGERGAKRLKTEEIKEDYVADELEEDGDWAVYSKMVNTENAVEAVQSAEVIKQEASN